MTREEAIEVLKKTVDNSVEMTMREWEEFDKLMIEAIDMAIEALSVVQCNNCKHQEHCEKTVAHKRGNDGFSVKWLETIEWCSRGERKGGDTE